MVPWGPRPDAAGKDCLRAARESHWRAVDFVCNRKPSTLAASMDRARHPISHDACVRPGELHCRPQAQATSGGRSAPLDPAHPDEATPLIGSTQISDAPRALAFFALSSIAGEGGTRREATGG